MINKKILIIVLFSQINNFFGMIDFFKKNKPAIVVSSLSVILGYFLRPTGRIKTFQLREKEEEKFINGKRYLIKKGGSFFLSEEDFINTFKKNGVTFSKEQEEKIKQYYKEPSKKNSEDIDNMIKEKRDIEIKKNKFKLHARYSLISILVLVAPLLRIKSKEVFSFIFGEDKNFIFYLFFYLIGHFIRGNKGSDFADKSQRFGNDFYVLHSS